MLLLNLCFVCDNIVRYLNITMIFIFVSFSLYFLLTDDYIDFSYFLKLFSDKMMGIMLLTNPFLVVTYDFGDQLHDLLYIKYVRVSKCGVSWIINFSPFYSGIVPL